jgi:hypothetical protein
MSSEQAFRVSQEDAKWQLVRFDLGLKFTPEIREQMQSAGKLLIEMKVIEQIPNLNEYLRPNL